MYTFIFVNYYYCVFMCLQQPTNTTLDLHVNSLKGAQNRGTCQGGSTFSKRFHFGTTPG